MKVSIIIRTYNRPLMLKESLASIHLQSYKNWEVIIFDDGDANQETLNVIKNFRTQNPQNNIYYFNSNVTKYFFKKSWEISPQISQGEIMVRLDDDDLLAKNSINTLVKIYTEHPLLDYSYGSCGIFEENNLIENVITQSPLEAPKTKDIWGGYLTDYPWNDPYYFKIDYYNEPRHYTSIVHCSKADVFCTYHPYVIRTSSALKVLNKFKIISDKVDDLEAMGSLDYLGLRHTSLKSILSYVRNHNKGRVTDAGIEVKNDLYETRDRVEYLRPKNFTSNIYLENIKENKGYKEINDTDKLNFQEYYNSVKLISKQY